MLSQSLKSRLDFEERIIAKHLPSFDAYLYGDNPYFEGRYTTTSGGRGYKLKLVIPSWYPSDMPSLYVTYPTRLRKYGYSGSINNEGTSHAFHTKSNGPGGCVQICHFRSDNWDASQTCAGVLAKGIMWLEAYDCHLATGRNIADILENFRRKISW